MKRIISLILVLLTAHFIGAENLRLTLFPNISVNTNDGFTTFDGDYNAVVARDGSIIPVVMKDIILPPHADLGTVDVTVTVLSSEKHKQKIALQKSSLSLGNDIPLPLNQNPDLKATLENPLYLYRTSQLHSLKIVTIGIYPFQYNNFDTTLIKNNQLEVDISYTKHVGPQLSKLPSFYLPMIKEAINFESMIGKYELSSSRKSTYAIITTKEIESKSQELANFIQSKRNHNFDVKVITNWGTRRGDQGADQLRKWLQENYQKLNIQYILLIGNPDPQSGDLPMKITHPFRETPTDFYFADLTGNWDKNGNGKFGEQADLGSGGIDHKAELSVGRIPVYNNNIDQLDKILKKTVIYENAPSNEIGWRKKMLLCMKGYNAPKEGSRVGEAIKKAVNSSNSGWSFYRIYDNADGNPELIGVTENFLLMALQQNKSGIVQWMTHGSATNAMHIMSSSNTVKWDDTHPSIVFCGSCLNAKPSVSTNLTYSLLKNGAIGAIGGTQTTIFSTGSSMENSAFNSGFLYQFGKHSTSGMNLGDALNTIKASNIPTGNDWQNYLAFTLYGCPAININSNGDNTSLNSVVKSPQRQFTVYNKKQTLQIDLNSSSNTVTSISIINAHGRTLIKKNTGSQRNIFDINTFTQGVYFVIVKQGNTHYTKRITIRSN